MTRRWLAIGAVVFASFAGCGGGDQATTGAAPSPSPAPSAGETTQSSENELPEQFPSDFPLPEGSEVAYSAWTGDVGGLVYFRADGSDEEIRQSFESRLGEAGWTLVSCQTLTEPTQLTVMTASKDTQIASVSIGSGEGPQGVFEGEYSFWVSIVLRSPQEVSGTEPATCQEVGAGS